MSTSSATATAAGPHGDADAPERRDIPTSRPPATRRRRRRLPWGLTPGVVLAAAFALFLLAAVLVPGVVGGGSPLDTEPSAAFTGPSAAHPFGTDESGRDIYTRVVHGTRQSLAIGFGAAGLALAVGAVLALIGGLGGRWADEVVSRVLDSLFAFPQLLLALLFIAAFGVGVVTTAVAVGIATAPGFARIIRAQVLVAKGSGYVEAARGLGHPPARIIGRHILPNAMRPLIALGTLGVGQCIVWAASLSFLGLGAAPPAPEWGAMLAAGRDYIGVAWWLTIFPGAVIVLATLSTTTIGRYLQRRIEGRA